MNKCVDALFWNCSWIEQTFAKCRHRVAIFIRRTPFIHWENCININKLSATSGCKLTQDSFFICIANRIVNYKSNWIHLQNGSSSATPLFKQRFRQRLDENRSITWRDEKKTFLYDFKNSQLVSRQSWMGMCNSRILILLH